VLPHIESEEFLGAEVAADVAGDVHIIVDDGGLK
jgi:hypothetical protein